MVLWVVNINYSVTRINVCESIIIWVIFTDIRHLICEFKQGGNMLELTVDNGSSLAVCKFCVPALCTKLIHSFIF